MRAPGDRFDGEYIRAYFREVDAMRPRELVKWYTPKGSFRFANNPPVMGADAMIGTLEQFYATLKSMRHKEQGLWVAGGAGVFEALVTFETQDGRTVSIPAASILRTEGGFVQDFRFIMDAAPLVSRATG